MAPSQSIERPGIERRDTGDYSSYVPSQEHLLRPTADNPLPTAVPPPQMALAGTLGARHVFCFIGLPERGKPFIANRIYQYLTFFHGVSVKLFDVSRYSQETGAPAGSDENALALLNDLRAFMHGNSVSAGRNMDAAVSPCRTPSRGQSFNNELDGQQGPDPGGSPFESDASAAADAPPLVATKSQQALVEESDMRRKNVDSGRVALIFATDSFGSFKEHWAGTSKERRRWVADVIEGDRTLLAGITFIEVIVHAPAIISANIRAKAAAQQRPEPSTQQIREVAARISEYARSYVTLQADGSEDDLSYIKLIDYGKKVVANKMHGHLKMRIAQFLTTIHTTPHVIYLSRHGQSEYNVLGKIGGNPPLSAAGDEYAERLGRWVPQHVWQQEGRLVRCRLWTSSLQRTILTARHIPHPAMSAAELSTELQLAEPSDVDCDDSEQLWEQMEPLGAASTAPRVYRSLDEIFAGEYEGYRYEEIKAKDPNEADLRKIDKLGYRYPRGESYFDIIQRLDPLVHEMESYHEPLLIVSHQAVLRLVYSYLMQIPRTKATNQEVPLHTVIKITYDGWSQPKEERFFLGPDPKADDGQANL